MSGRLEGRIALVTGASRGIGRAIAKRFCEEGATVVAVARTQGALEELDDEVRADGRGTIVLVPEDFRDATKIDQVAAALYQRFGKIDILVGNAGTLGMLAPMSHIKPSIWDDVIATNLTANWQLIRYMEPLLRQSDAGRAVFMSSSVGGLDSRAYWGAYGVSKAGLEMMVRTWAEELAKTSVRANIYDPGRTRTRMRASAFPGEDPMSLPAPEDHCDYVLDLVTPDCTKNGERIAFKELRKMEASNA